MNARNNHAVVEGLATMGLGHDVRFQWCDWPIDAIHVSNALRQESLHIPKMEAATTDQAADSTVALALMGVQAHGQTDFALWPESGLRREALAALELGAAAGKVAGKMPHMMGRLDALFTSLVSTADMATTDTERMLQVLLLSGLEFTANLGEKVRWHEMPDQEVQLGQFLRDALPKADTTAKRVEIIALLIPEDEPSCMPQDDSGEAPADQQPQGEQPPENSPPEQSGDGQGQSAPPGGEETSESAPAEEQGSSQNDSKQADTGGPDAESEQGVAEQSDDAQAGAESETCETVPETDQAAKAAVADEGEEEPQEGEAKALAVEPPICESPDADSPEVEVLSAALSAGGGFDVAPPTPEQAPGLRALEAKIVTSMLRVLQDRRRQSKGFTHAGARVAGSRVWRFQHLGDTRIFRKGVQRSGVDVAVTVLLDRSGSMDLDNRMQVARESTIAFANAMTRVNGVKVSVEVFPGNRGADCILPFDGSVNKARDLIAGVKPSGGTPLHLAIEKIMPTLLMRKEQRKVLLIITDGQPSSAAAAAHQVELAQNQEIQVLGVGIGGGACMDSLIECNKHIYNASELPDALVQLFGVMNIEA